MAANSVSGSFKGIEVSFSFNGPQIVMSVLNTIEDGRRLRVMFQQQPISGRVNWTSLQLTEQTQNVVVPPEVINSHKIVFYVDDDEPIVTYTEGILDELQHLQVPERDNDNLQTSTDELVPPEPKQHTSESNEESNEEKYNKKTDELVPEPKQHTSESNEEKYNKKVENSTNGSQVTNILPNKVDSVNSLADNVSLHTQTDEKTGEKGSADDIGNMNLKMEDSSPIDPQNSVTNPKTDMHQPSPQQDVPKATIPNQKPTEQPIPKRKTHYVERYAPQVSTELQFKIKVPTIPKSASKKEVTFIPSRSAISSKSNNKKYGLFGQLAGAIGLNVSKKKHYFMQENQHLYEKFHANLEKMERDYNDGSGIPLDKWDLASLSEQQTAVLLLNLMVNELNSWKKDAKKASSTKNTLAKSLEEIEKELKQILKQTRGIDAPSPTLFPDRTAASEQDLMRIQKDCDVYLERFSEKLAVLEQNHAEKVRVPAFKKFLLEFVRDKLFPKAAEFSSMKSVQKRLNWFLNLVDFELIPIEPGKTKFSSEHHEVKEKRSSDLESNTIVEVVSPGLQTKDGKRIIQNAVVIQAE